TGTPVGRAKPGFATPSGSPADGVTAASVTLPRPFGVESEGVVWAPVTTWFAGVATPSSWAGTVGRGAGAMGSAATGVRGRGGGSVPRSRTARPGGATGERAGWPP